MKPCYLFVCITHLQLICSLNILDEKLENGEDFDADLILLTDGRVGMAELESPCKELNLFRHVVFLPHAKKFRLQSRLKDFSKNEIKFSECILYTSKFLRSTLLNIKTKLPFRDYQSVYFFASNAWMKTILKQLNTQVKFHILDEGLGSYTSPEHIGNKIDFLHLYEPELACLNQELQNKTVKLKKISRDRVRLVKWLTTLFQHTKKASHEIYFFDQPLEKHPSDDDPIFVVKKEILNYFVAQNKNENLIIRAHPRTSDELKSFFEQEFGKVFSTEQSNIPFEIELLLRDDFARELHTISSSGVLYWLFMFDNTQNLGTKVYIYYPWFCKKLTNSVLPNQDRIVEFFHKVQKKFPQQIFFKNEPMEK